ncbi:MAG: B12-binding domain-containing radical SAM protein [Promethearchaeota archaeon]
MEGRKVVLTADRSLFSDFRENFFFGFISVAPTNAIPRSFQHRFFCPPPTSNVDGTAKYALLALRCLESTFIENGVPENDIAVAHPNNIYKFIGERTEFVCVSSHDPLGIGPATSTWSSLFRGIPFNRVEFEKLLLNDISRLKKKYNFKLAVGGPGSWQLMHEDLLNKFKIDFLGIGESEVLIPEILNYPKDRIITGPLPSINKISPIKNPTAGGLIEITRGCGLGCTFCSPTLRGALRSLPLTKILTDVRVNVQTGRNGTVNMQSENSLNYGSSTLLPDEDTIMELYSSIFEIKGVKRVYMTHNCLAPIAYMPQFIERLSKFLRQHGQLFNTCQPGIETGSPRLIKEFMPNKSHPYEPEEWPNVVRKAFKVLYDNRWFCAATLMVGLPGETKEDVLQTIELIKSIDKYNTFVVVPLFFNPIEPTKVGDQNGFTANRITEENWKLIVLCWKHNLRIGRNLYSMSNSEHHSFITKIIMNLGIQIAKLGFPIFFYNFHRKLAHIWKTTRE